MSEREARARTLLESMPVSDCIVEWPSVNEAVAAMLAFADIELERAAEVADEQITICMQRVDGRGLNDAKRIRDRIRKMMENDDG